MSWDVTCDCLVGDEGDPVAAACCSPPAPPSAVTNGFSDLWDTLANAGCDLQDTTSEVGTCEEAELSPVLGNECPEGSPMRAPSEDYLLLVDSVGSFILLDDGESTMLLSATGGGSLGAGPAEFLTGLVWAQSGSLGGNQYSDWILWFDGPLSLDPQASAYTLPSGLTIQGSGKVDGTWAYFGAAAAEQACGEVDLSAGTWSLDYSESMAATSIEVYLEGTVE